jgi:hypothetical protein
VGKKEIRVNRGFFREDIRGKYVGARPFRIRQVFCSKMGVYERGIYVSLQEQLQAEASPIEGNDVVGYRLSVYCFVTEASSMMTGKT